MPEGKPGHPEVEPPAASPAPPTPAELLDGWLKEILNTTVRGIVSVHCRAPVEMVLIAICRTMGAIMGRLYGGDELAVARFRKACRDAFRDAIKAEAVTPLPKPPERKPHGAND